MSGTAALLMLLAMGPGCASDHEDEGTNNPEGMGGNGSGGSGSAGGGSAGDGVGGVGTVEPLFNEYPSCLIELFASCGTDSACTIQGADAGLPAQRCYASGARAEYTRSPTCADDGSGPEVRVTRPDGSLCFTHVVSDRYIGQSCENGTLTWTNAAGETVATGRYGHGIGYGETITCTGSGDATSCRYPCRPRPYGWLSSQACSEGTCP